MDAVRVAGRQGAPVWLAVWLVQLAAVPAVVADDDPVLIAIDTVVNIFDTTVFGSSDPAGLSYDPLTETLLLVDSEVEETPFFTGNNGFRLQLDGQLVSSFDTTGFSNEPTGIVLNPVTGTVFITDDDLRMVFEIDIDVTPPTVLSSFATAGLGLLDPEGISAHPVTGNLFVAEGIGGIPAVHELTPGGTPVSLFLAPDQIDDPEGVHYDSLHDTFLVVSSPNRNIFEVSAQGVLIADYDIQPIRDMYGHLRVKGMVLAPSSDPTDAPEVMHVYFADYNFDEENDGRIFEIALPPLDLDEDGVSRDLDCDDHDDSVFPGAVEVIGDGVDQDCNGYDLTTRIVSLVYLPTEQVFHIVASSALGAEAALQVQLELANGQTVTRNLRWRATTGTWAKQIFRVVQRFDSVPQSVVVSGVEGATLPVPVPGPANGPYVPDPDF